MLDINQIRDILPHRYPMLLVDRIVEITEDRIVGLKNVTANEPFFQGHFPCYPVMPGVLIVETMAQVGAVLLLGAVERRDDKLVLFTTIEQAKFRKPVVPGDQLRVEMQVLKRKATVCKMSGKVTVEGKLVAEAVLMCQLADRPTPGPPAGEPPAVSGGS
jgi:3-hydroxyacyl-[acyl-carrier-protein] dehydratase